MPRALIDCMPLNAGGGVQVAIALLENLLAYEPFEWRVALPQKVRDALPDTLAAGLGERARILPKAATKDVVAIRRGLGQLERDMAADVVFTVFGPAYYQPRAPHLVGFALPHLIYDYHPALPPYPIKERAADIWRRGAFRQADHLVVETETAAARLHQWLGIEPGRISVIGNSVNPLLDAAQPTPLPDALDILVPSTHYPHKNLGIIPTVARKVADLAPDLAFRIRLTLPPSLPAWRSIADASDALGVSSHVATVGNLDLSALANAYHAHRMVLLPTLREISTAVYPEAFHFRRPLVTSDIDFARELCGDAAVYTSPTDPDAMARSIVALHDDPARIAALVANGARRLDDVYPTPAGKFAAQVALIRRMAAMGKRSAA